jgi:hypothetical protein
MRPTRLIVVLASLGLAACAGASTQGVAVRAPRGEIASRGGEIDRSILAAFDTVRAPIAPEAALEIAVALYEKGEPPPSSALVANMYQTVCADADRSRVRRQAYDSGSDVARRQDCYCAAEMPCSRNRDCSDLVVCHPQIALGETGARRAAF